MIGKSPKLVNIFRRVAPFSFQLVVICEQIQKDDDKVRVFSSLQMYILKYERFKVRSFWNS